jgi:hypothetical protein
MSGKNSFIYFIFIFFTVTNAFSQIKINGSITEASGETLPGASVILNNSDDKMIAYAITNDDGSYTLTINTPGDYILTANYMGYEKQSLPITVTADIKSSAYNFTLKPAATELKEVIIQAEQPVRLKGDTLVYDAKALRTGHEVVVEDLLKNIPGITIQKDGRIMYGDREIEKVMVDGDDLFNRGYSLLTKNMPSQPLDKVEVLQNYSNNKLLKGIEESGKVALNLTVDEAYKNLWFGNLLAGYGNENRYRTEGNLMNFSKNYKNFLSINANNAGYDNIGNINAMFYSSNDLESIGGAQAQQVMSLGFKAPRLDEDRTRFNNAQMATLSTIFPLWAQAKLKLTGFAGLDRRRAFQDSYSVINTDFASFENTEVNRSRENLKKGYVNALFSYDVSATQMLQYSGTYNGGNTDFNNDFTFNGISTREQLETRNTYLDQKLTYTHKWQGRNVVLIKARFLTDRLPQNYGINDYLLGDLFAQDSINSIGNTINSSKQYAGLEADFKLKQNNNDLIEFTVGFENHNDDLATRFSLFTDAGKVNPEGFQSNATYNVSDLYARSGYTYRINRVKLNATLNVHQLFNRFSNIEGNTTRQNPFIVNPFFNASWEIKPDNVLTATYSYNVTNSSLLQVNDAYLLTSSRSFSRGLGFFNQLQGSSAALNYTTKHYLNRYSLSAGVNYSKQNDVISYRSRLNQNSSLSEAFVMQGGDQFGASINTHLIVKPLKGIVKFNARADRSVYFNQINNSGLRKNIYYSETLEFGWNSSFKSFFNFNFGTEWTFSQVESDNNFSNSNKYSFLDLMFKVTDKFTVKAETEHYYFGGLNRYNNYFFADVQGSYAFAQDKYTIGLDARNLFNTDVFTTYSISDIGYSTNSYRLLPRIILITFKYRF